MTGRAVLLAAVIVLQGVAAVFFLGDVFADVRIDGRLGGLHMWLELLAAISLVCGVVVLTVELRRVIGRMTTLETSVRAARGEMAAVIDAFFAEWRLTPSERDVALMVLKGIENEAIARMRGTAPGTVRAQCTAIYTKAEVDGRAQLLSVFLEELLAGEADTTA